VIAFGPCTWTIPPPAAGRQLRELKSALSSNVLKKLRACEALSEKEQQIHDAGLVSVLRQLHHAAALRRRRWRV
jgi:hypothetical protein